MKRSWGLWTSLAVGGGLRLHHAWSASGVLNMDWPGWGHYQTGLSLLTRQFFSFDLFGGFALPGRGPLYPSFLALAELPFSSPHPGWALLATALLSTASIALAYNLGSRLVSPLAGLGAALCLALDPFSIKAVSSLNVHAFYSLVLISTASAVVAWAEKPDARTGVWAGLCLGASLLCRGAHLLLVSLLTGALFIWEGRKKQAWRTWATAVGAAFILLAPVALRQSLQAGRVMILDSGTGSYGLFTAAMGNDEIASESRAIELAETLRPGIGEAHVHDVPGLEASLRKLAVSEILAHPGRYLRGVLRRLWFFWLPLAPALLLGGWALWKDRKNRGLQALALCLASLSGYAAIGISDEYRLAAHPLAAVLGGCGLGLLFDRNGKPDAKRAAWGRSFGEGWLVACAAAALLFLGAELIRYGWPARPAPLPAALPARLERHLALAARSPAEVARLAVSLDARGHKAEADARLSAKLKEVLTADLLALRSRLTGSKPLFLRALALDAKLVCFASRPFLAVERHEAEPEYFSLCLQRFPNDPTLLTDRGVAFFRRGDKRRALQDFRRALRLRPGFEPAIKSAETMESESSRF